MKKILAPILSVIILVGVTLGAFFLIKGAIPKNKTYSLSIGVSVSEDFAKSKVSHTVAAIVTDKDGKIVALRLDTLDYTAKVDENGALVIAKPQTKMELGSNYGMASWGGAIAEWDAQAKHFESYVTGMTLEQVLAITNDMQSPDAPADLVAGCTISSSVPEFKNAIKKAFDNQYKTTFTTTGTVKLGVAITPAVSDTSDNDNNLITLKYGYSAIAEAEGKIVGAILDESENVLKVEIENKAITLAAWNSGNKLQIKLEQGDNYGMVAWGGANGEWYAQAQNYANTAIGKATTGLTDLPIENVAGCTIYMGNMKQTLIKAAGNVR